MSWFKHRPKVKEPPKHLPHHRTSPATEKMLKEVKEKAQSNPPKKIK